MLDVSVSFAIILHKSVVAYGSTISH
jgi:hypothetical protein